MKIGADNRRHDEERKQEDTKMGEELRAGRSARQWDRDGGEGGDRCQHNKGKMADGNVARNEGITSTGRENTEVNDARDKDRSNRHRREEQEERIGDQLPQGNRREYGKRWPEKGDSRGENYDDRRDGERLALYGWPEICKVDRGLEPVM